ncbi:type II toxin-antitoxin system RelE/ParE family toxin [Bordetella genomosp. 5]|uniref:type II toxin-antitoxin system RelE/ParE family toxin n=1 Tax=Bordetella genomosp. 5 TaxID=1395608 RepID=UPI0034E8C349
MRPAQADFGHGPVQDSVLILARRTIGIHCFYIIIYMKPLCFVGSALAELRAFPADARRQAGFELDAIQRGFMPSDFKPLITVGPGVYEIRIHVAGEWRIIFIARRMEAIYVLHAFQKKSRALSLSDLELAIRRYRSLQETR